MSPVCNDEDKDAEVGVIYAGILMYLNLVPKNYS